MININEMFSIVKDMKIETLKDNATFQELDSFVSELKNSSNPQHRFMALRLENRLKENQNYQEYRKSIELKTEEKREIDREKKINKEFDEKQAIGGRVMDAKKKAEAEKIKKEEKELADFSLKNLSCNQQMMKIQMLMDNVDKYSASFVINALGNVNEAIENTQDPNKKRELIIKAVDANTALLEKGNSISAKDMPTLYLDSQKIENSVKKALESDPNNKELQARKVQAAKNTFRAGFMTALHLGWDPETKSYLNEKGEKVKTIVVDDRGEMDINKLEDEEMNRFLSRAVEDAKNNPAYQQIDMPKVTGMALATNLGKVQDYKKAESVLIEGVLNAATDSNAKKIVGENVSSEILEEEKIKIAYIATKKMVEQINSDNADELNVINLTRAKIRNYLSGVSQDMALDESMQKMYRENPAEFKGYIMGFGFTASDVEHIKNQMDIHTKYYEEHPEVYRRLTFNLNNRSEDQAASLLYISQNMDIINKFFTSDEFQGGKHTAIEFRTLLTKNITDQVIRGQEIDLAKAIKDTVEQNGNKYNLNYEELMNSLDKYIQNNAHINRLTSTNLNEVLQKITEHSKNVSMELKEQIKDTNIEEINKQASKQNNISTIVSSNIAFAKNVVNIPSNNYKMNKHSNLNNAPVGLSSMVVAKKTIESHIGDIEYAKNEDINSTMIADKIGDIMQKTINGENQKMLEESQQPDNKPSYAENANKILRQMQEQEKEEMERQNNINLASNTSTKA